MNVGDIKTRVKRQFGDESAVQVTDDDIIRWINDAQRDFVMQTETLLETVRTIDTQAGTQDYAYPTDLFILRNVRYKGSTDTSFHRLMYLNLQQFDELMDGWDGNTTTETQAAPRWYTSYENRIYIYPTPFESITGGLKILYSRYPTDISLDSDVPDLPINYHNAILNYCLQKAYELDEDLNAAQFAAQQAEADIKLNQEKQQRDNEEYYPTISIRYEDI